MDRLRSAQQLYQVHDSFFQVMAPFDLFWKTKEK